MPKQGAVFLAALLDEVGRSCQLDAPNLVRGLLLHADDEKAGGPEHVEVEGGLAVVVVLLDGGEKMV